MNASANFEWVFSFCIGSYPLQSSTLYNSKKKGVLANFLNAHIQSRKKSNKKTAMWLLNVSSSCIYKQYHGIYVYAQGIILVYLEHERSHELTNMTTIKKRNMFPFIILNTKNSDMLTFFPPPTNVLLYFC